MVETIASWMPPLRRDRAPIAPGMMRTLTAGWWIPTVAAVIALALAVAALRALPPEHTATMVVGPIARSGAAAMGARAPGPARSDLPLSVVEFGGGDELLSDFTRFIELLTSPPVAARLLPEPGLAAHLFPERWDAAAGRWRHPSGVTGWLRGVAFALAGREDWVEPDAEILARQLRRLVIVQPVGTTPMRRLVVRDADRAFAVGLLDRLAAAADAHLRAQAAQRTAAQIAHIRRRLDQTPGNDDRRALLDLLADQERIAMMIGVDLPYAADRLEPPGAPGSPDWPNPLTLLPLATAAGAGLGVFVVFARSARGRDTDRRRRSWGGRR